MRLLLLLRDLFDVKETTRQARRKLYDMSQPTEPPEKDFVIPIIIENQKAFFNSLSCSSPDESKERSS